MENKNIIFNHTIEQYNKRYKNRKYRLLKFTKKEVEEFDKKNGCKNKLLLNNKKWWFIKDTYYEVPKPVRYTWFRNLNAGVQTGICLLGAGVVATAVTVPLILMNNREKIDEHFDFTDKETVQELKDQGFSDDFIRKVQLSSKVETHNDENGNQINTLYFDNEEVKSKVKFSGIIQIKIGEDKLKDSEYKATPNDNGTLEVIIKKEVLVEHTGKVVFTPKIVKKSSDEPKVEDIAVNIDNVRQHYIGNKLDLDHIKVLAHLSTGKDVEVDKSELTFSPAEGTILEKNTEVSVTYKSITKKFNIVVNEPIPTSDLFVITVKDQGKKTCSIRFNYFSDVKLTQDFSLTIPEKIEKEGTEYTVVEIDQWGFSGYIPITYYKTECYKIKELYLPSTLEKIGIGGFCYCNSIKSVLIPASVTKIDELAFAGGYFELNSNIEGSLNSVEIEKNSNLSVIAGDAFAYQKLSSIELPESLKALGENAFYSCKNLKSVTIPSSAIQIASGCFSGCEELETVNFSNKNSEIMLGMEAFKNCVKLKNIDLQNVVYFGKLCFYGCRLLSKVKLSNKIVYCENGIFAYCPEIEMSMDTGGLGSYRLSESGALLNDEGEGYYSILQASKNSIVDKNITRIWHYAFAGNETIKELDISSNDYIIGDILSNAFEGCKNLETVKLSQYVQVFSGDKNTQNPFTNCPNLKTITVDSNNSYIEAPGNNTLIKKPDEGQIEVITGTINTKLSEIYPGDYTFVIGNEAFRGVGFSKLNEAFLDRVEEIADGAFADCANLTEINIPSSVFSICKSYEFEDERNIFKNCSSLKTINVNEDNTQYYSRGDNGIYRDVSGENWLFAACGNTSLKNCNHISAYTFYGLKDLTEITIPANVTGLDSNSFFKCDNLKTIIIDSPEVATSRYDNLNIISLLKNASTVYINKKIDEKPTGDEDDYTYIGCLKFLKLVESDKTGYDKWVINNY